MKRYTPSIIKQNKMDPREKAEKIVVKFIKKNMVFGEAKQCATIVVKEVISEVDMYFFSSFEKLDRIDYWKKVIEEIDKM